MTSGIYLELNDEPEGINRVVTALEAAGMNIVDINYTIYDTDFGKAVCIISVEPGRVPNQEAILAAIQQQLAQKRTRPVPYERWFRYPKVRFTVISDDKVGLVRELVANTVQSLDKGRTSASGNILGLQGFAVSDHGLYAVQMHVATTSLFVQARLISFFRQFCEEHHVRTYDVVYDNYLYEYVEEAESNAS